MDITKLIECAEREIKLRRRVYPRWVESKKMSQAKADSEIAMMQEIRDVLVRVQGESKTESILTSPGLFDRVFGEFDKPKGGYGND